MAKPLTPFAKPTEVFDTALGWRFINPKMRTLDDGDATLSLGECTEKLAELYGITRDQADHFAARSHERATQAWAAGHFDGEVIEIPVLTKKDTTFVRTDETVRSDTTFDKLQSLKPSFRPSGVTTAGNASPLSDGASGIVVASEKSIAEHGWTPRARIVSYAVAGVAPSLFGLGPVPAIRKLLERTGLSLEDIGVIEINEAFAAQVLACTTELEIDPERINASGGGISLGHPLGSSGSRLVLNALGELERTGERFAIVSLCIGVGQGAAMLIEREDST
jgi:acetyl-CoA acetyltransferase family protein